MYLTIDVGGTKTLIALFNRNYKLIKKTKIVTNSNYQQFLKDLKKTIDNLKFYDFDSIGLAVPGIINTLSGEILHGGVNLSWQKANPVIDLHKIYSTPVFIGNDANLAGLYESIYFKDSFSKVMYLTISTGIGGSYYVDQQLDKQLTNFEPGKMIFDHNGKKTEWEKFASGKSIVETYGMFARDINDETIWKEISSNIAEGLLAIIPVLQPEVITFGGSIGVFFERYAKYLNNILAKELDHAIPRPRLIEANKPEEAVVYGCLEMIKLNS